MESSAARTSSANANQRAAIESTEGPLLIIAGPGSGKTFTLVERIVYLVTHVGVKLEELLVVTFTDKAAQELTTRIANRLAEIDVRLNLNEMYLGTFHSICLRWLEEHREFTRLKRNFTMMDQFDQQYFLYQNLSAYTDIDNAEAIIGETGGNWYKSQALLKWLNTVSEEALDVSTLKNAKHRSVQPLGYLYERYQQELEQANALDFSTIQYEALKLLKEQPAVLESLRKKIRYLMVDEYQDTNTIQEAILMLLAGDEPNLCVVGDDDQGLYRFRGATIRNILEFPQNFPEGTCEQVKLSTNYRSHPDIVSFFDSFMEEKNWTVGDKTFRYTKQITAQEDKSFPDVATVIKVNASSATTWHKEVLAMLHSLRDDGQLKDWNQVAFLFRSVRGKKAVSLARFLEANHIPVYSPRSNQFFEREEIKLLIGALIFIFPQFAEVRQWRSDAKLEIWDYYDQECFKLFAEQLKDPRNRDLLLWCKEKARDHAVMTQNANYAFTGLFYELLKFPLFSRYLDEDLLKQNLTDSRAMRNLAVFSKLLGKFEYLSHIQVLVPDFLDKNLRDLFNQFLRYLKDGGINEYEDETEYAPSGNVSFLTIHQAKGLEFPVVFVGSMEARPMKQHSNLDVLLQQHYYAKPPFEPLEQTKFFDFWRLFYTAFSRAQNLLVLTYPEHGGSWASPSKHFQDLVDSLPSWRDDRFDPSKLALESIKAVNLKQEYSFTSHLTVFENCAEQYRFFKELDFAPVRTSPILFGTLVHQTIEDIHRAVLRGEEHKLSEDRIGGWFDTNYAYLTKRERVYLAPIVKQFALNHILRYFERQSGNWDRIREAEVDVSLVKDDYILRGTIDLIRGENDTVEIVDFKSEKKLDVNDPKDRDKLDRYRRQLEVYAHIIEERTGLKVSKTHLYYTGVEDGNPYISFNKNDASLERTIQTFDDVVNLIETKDFRIMERPYKLCEACDMRHYCGAKNWKFRGKA